VLVFNSVHRVRPNEPQTTRTASFTATTTTRVQIHASGEIGSGVVFTGLTPPDGSDRVLGAGDRSWAYFGAADAREYALVGRLEGSSVQSAFFYIGSASAFLLNDDFLRMIGAMELRDQPVVLRLVVNRPNLEGSAAGDNEWLVSVEVTQDELPRETFILTVTPRPPQAFATPDFYYELGTRIRVSARGLISTGVVGTRGTPPSGWAGAGAGAGGGEVGRDWRDWPLRGPGVRRYCLVGRIAGDGYGLDLEVFGAFREKVGDGRVTGMHRLVLGMLRPNFDSPDAAGDGAWTVLVEVFDPPRPPRAAMRPALSIANMEIVQSVQRADGTIPVVAGKRTLVRAFVDSGLRGTDLGDGIDLQRHVTGRLRITGPGAAPPLDLLPNFDSNEVVARPPAQMRRDDLTHSLNFLLPLERTSGVLACDLSVFVEGHADDAEPGWRATATRSVSFLPGRRRNIQPVLVAHSGHSERPTLLQFLAMLAGATRRFPVPENFFVVLPPRTFDLAGEIDLSRSSNDWSRAIAALIALEDGSPTIIAGIVFQPAPSETEVHGIHRTNSRTVLAAAHGGPEWAEPFSQAKAEHAMAHELGHLFGLFHAHGCVDDRIDPRLPTDGRTDEVGVDPANRQTARRGVAEIMGYCDPPHWVSTACYQIILES
jgi:hypothetical protein